MLLTVMAFLSPKIEIPFFKRERERKGGFNFMMDRRILTMTSQTLALKAKRVLFQQGISVQIVRPSPRLTPRGCSYGMEMRMHQIARAIDILEENRISKTNREMEVWRWKGKASSSG